MKEPRLPPAASDKGLKVDDGQNTKIYRERKEPEAGLSEYLAKGNYNVVQATSGMVQGFKHGCDPHIEALPLQALYVIVESEERRCWILRTRLPE